jgi:hypothetical protein
VNALALEGNKLFRLGSSVSIQACVPGAELERTIKTLEEFMTARRFCQLDIWTARRYDVDDPDEEYPNDYLRRDVLLAVTTSECVLSVYVLSEETAGFREVPDA